MSVSGRRGSWSKPTASPAPKPKLSPSEKSGTSPAIVMGVAASRTSSDILGLVDTGLEKRSIIDWRALARCDHFGDAEETVLRESSSRSSSSRLPTSVVMLSRIQTSWRLFHEYTVISWTAQRVQRCAVATQTVMGNSTTTLFWHAGDAMEDVSAGEDEDLFDADCDGIAGRVRCWGSGTVQTLIAM